MSRPPASSRSGLILASASPRRVDILRAAGLCFDVQPSHVEEDFDPRLPPEIAGPELALRKAAAIAGRLAGTDRFVIAADTLVALDPLEPGGPWRYLGKPVDAGEARRFLGLLSGTRHQVLTGVAVQRCRDGARFVGYAQTWVHMRALAPGEVEAYVESREWCGKAGGYAIQESADAFVTRLEGDFDTVVGLPLGLTLRLLESAGASLPPGGVR